jgi:hypothetical protein
LFSSWKKFIVCVDAVPKEELPRAANRVKLRPTPSTEVKSSRSVDQIVESPTR